MKLYICGNGFDLHHKLPTAYKDYKIFLEHNHKEIVFDFEYYTKIGKTYEFCWSDIEQSLKIDFSKLIQACLIEAIGTDTPLIIHQENYKLYEDYLADETAIFRPDSLSDRVEHLVSFIDNFTAIYFLEWLSTIDYSHASPDLELKIHPDDLFITFNYLDSLKYLYKIPDKRVLHVHGSIDKLKSIGNVMSKCRKIAGRRPRFNSDDYDALIRLMMVYEIRGELQFGAAINPDQVSRHVFELYKGNLEFVDANALIDNAIYNSTKRITDNYDSIIDFLSSSKNIIDTVVVMGHSLNGGDFPYYRDVFLKLFKDKMWFFYFHDDSHSEEDKFIARTRIKNYRLLKW